MEVGAANQAGVAMLEASGDATNLVGGRRVTRAASAAAQEADETEQEADNSRKRDHENVAEDSNSEQEDFPVNQDDDAIDQEDDESTGTLNMDNVVANIQNDETDIVSNDEDDNEEEEADDSDDEVEDRPPNTMMRSRLRDFCTPGRFRLPLTQAELTGIKLLDILRKKKAPMNAYKEVYQWHLQEKGQLQDHRGVGEAWHHFIGREALLDTLARRHNYTGREPFTKTIRLSHSKEVVRIPCHNAADCVERRAFAQ